MYVMLLRVMERCHLLITHELNWIEFHLIQIQGDKIIQPIFKKISIHILSFTKLPLNYG